VLLYVNTQAGQVSVMPSRTVSVVLRVGIAFLASLLAYVVIAFPIYGFFYGSLADSERFKALFWTSYSVHVLVSVAAAIGLASAFRARVVVVVVVATVAFGILALPTLGFLSFENECRFGRSFPIDGMAC
jgi:hypothetical protein